MKDIIKKWWNRKWGTWEEIQTLTYHTGEISAVILKRISNDGLIQIKKIRILKNLTLMQKMHSV